MNRFQAGMNLQYYKKKLLKIMKIEIILLKMQNDDEIENKIMNLMMIFLILKRLYIIINLLFFIRKQIIE